jgi:hypothetical protein
MLAYTYNPNVPKQMADSNNPQRVSLLQIAFVLLSREHGLSFMTHPSFIYILLYDQLKILDVYNKFQIKSIYLKSLRWIFFLAVLVHIVI